MPDLFNRIDQPGLEEVRHVPQERIARLKVRRQIFPWLGENRMSAADSTLPGRRARPSAKKLSRMRVTTEAASG